MHHQCIISTSSMHQQCIIGTSSAHHQCNIGISSMHHHCIISTSSAHQLAMANNLYFPSLVEYNYQSVYQLLVAGSQGTVILIVSNFRSRVLHHLLCLVLYQFQFQFIFGYELKTARYSSKIAKEPVVIHADCRKDMNKMKGTS